MIAKHPLSDALQYIRGVTFDPDELVSGDEPSAIACMRTKNVQKELDESDLIYVPKSVVKRDEQMLRPGDLLISSANSWELVGKTVRVNELAYPATAGGFISILRPNKEVVDPDYLYRFIAWDNSQHVIRHLGRQTTNISNLDRERFLTLPIPLPPLATQKHIARVLEQADQLRKQAQQMESELNQLAQSLFLEMFGDPVVNPKSWDIAELGTLVEITSGATPSKSSKRFWEGSFPWVSPKDMKKSEINDAIDHINECVFDESNLKKIEKDSILIVVRGMILAHTVPLAITTAPVAINQDIKALRLVDTSRVTPRYLLSVLVSLRDKILSIVSTAAHGTKRIETGDLCNLQIPIPPMEAQQKYCNAVANLRHQAQQANMAASHYDSLFQSLMQRAFNGELTAPERKAA